MRAMDRRQFLTSAAGLGGAVLLGGCGGSSGSGAAPTSTKHPPISKEPGNLAILEWDGYQAGGNSAQKSGLWGGTPYTTKYGGDSMTYTLIVNDSEALNKARLSQFDLLHPCAENIKDYVAGGLVQPFDTSLLPSFKNLNPALVKGGQVNGQQYFIPWDWGYGSVLYRTDKVDPADATGWELFWNPKYAGRISMWDGAFTNFEIAALKLGFPHIDNLSSDQLNAAKQALIQQKPLNKLLWKSEYTDLQPALQSGDVWIGYGWQDQWVYGLEHKPPIPIAFMQPSQGRLGWYCGFMLGKSTKNWFHAHEYVESFINHKAAVNMVNTFYYGNADVTITKAEVSDKTLVKSLELSNPNVLSSPSIHLQSWAPNEAALQQAWEEVVAA